MGISIELIKALREKTGAGVMDSKRALQKSEGDMGVAEEILREEGIASAAKKASRATNEGLIEAYIHSGGRIAALVELNCETDFVARTQDFKLLAHDIAMQVAAMSPKYVDCNDVPDEEQSGIEQVPLLQQPFIKDPTKTIQELVKETIGKLGENIQVRRFIRFSLGD